MLPSIVFQISVYQSVACIEMIYGYLFPPPDMNSWEAGDMSYPSLHPVVVLNIVMKHGLEFSPI